MIKIHTELLDNLEELKQEHFKWCLHYFQRNIVEEDKRLVYELVCNVLENQELDYDQMLLLDEDSRYNWLRSFLLADIQTLLTWKDSKREFLIRMLHTDDENPCIENQPFIKMYKAFSTKKKRDYCAAKLIEGLDIHICPYCDSSVLTTWNNSDYDDEEESCNANARGTDRDAEIDHFFPKSQYPLLAMCFYNLIPSCSTCNWKKNDSNITVSPYEEDIESLTRFTVERDEELNPDYKGKYKILFNEQKKIYDNIRVFQLKGRYNANTDLQNDIIVLMRNIKSISSKDYRNALKLIVGGVYDNPKDLLYQLEFNSCEINHIKNRPYQKLKRDIIDEKVNV